MVMKRLTTDIAGNRLGLEYSRVSVSGQPYLDRFILYCRGTLRLHKFYRGDDDRAPHDHPWWFVTFPFRSYVEQVWEPYVDPIPGIMDCIEYTRTVKAWRFHYRPARFRHFVIGRADGKKEPFWTFVITGGRSREWGFWPWPEFFVPWKQWFWPST